MPTVIQLYECDDRRRFAQPVALALLLRVLMMAWICAGPYALPDNPMARGYVDRGYRIADGAGYTHWDGEPAMLHPPGLSLMAAACRVVLRCDADLPLQAVGAFLDALAAGVVAWIGWTIFGRRVGMFAGFFYACWPPLVYFPVTKVPDGMMTLFVAGASACSLIAVARVGATRWTAFGMCGLLLGLASYLRPDYLLMPLAMAAVLWLLWGRPVPAIRAALVTQAVALLVLLPWAWRNHQICGRWIFTSTNVGPVLVTGLGEFRNPWGFGPSDQDREREALAAGFGGPWSPEADEHFRRVFIEAVRQYPGGYAMAIARRIPLAVAPPLTWGFRNPWRTVGLAELQRSGMDRYQILLARGGYVVSGYWDQLLTAGAGLLCMACAVIPMLKERGRRPLILLVLLPHTYTVGTHLLTHMEPRFLLPSYYCLILAAAYVAANRPWRLWLSATPTVAEVQA